MTNHEAPKSATMTRNQRLKACAEGRKDRTLDFVTMAESWLTCPTDRPRRRPLRRSASDSQWLRGRKAHGEALGPVLHHIDSRPKATPARAQALLLCPLLPALLLLLPLLILPCNLSPRALHHLSGVRRRRSIPPDPVSGCLRASEHPRSLSPCPLCGA